MHTIRQAPLKVLKFLSWHLEFGTDIKVNLAF